MKLLTAFKEQDKACSSKQVRGVGSEGRQGAAAGLPLLCATTHSSRRRAACRSNVGRGVASHRNRYAQP